MMRRFAPLLSVGAVVFITGCAAPRTPVPDPLRPALHRSRAESGLLRAQRSWEALARGDDRTAAVAEYNAGTREFIQAMIGSVLPAAWRGVHAMESPAGRLTVAFGVGGSGAEESPARFDRLLLAETKSANAAVPASLRAGLGVPMLARVGKSATASQRKTGYPNAGQFVPLTAWLEFSTGPGNTPRATLRLSDPRERTDVRVGRVARTMAADFGAPAHAILAPKNFVQLAFKGLLDPARFVPDRGIYLGEPFHPDKIPVILTHGLNSDPHIWENLATGIMADPELGRRFQIWYFAYPTGEPVLNTARAFRRSLAEVRGFYEAQNPRRPARELVLVGHSMGGLVCRLAVTDSGEAFYRAYFTRPIDELRFRPRVREEIRAALYFRPVPGAARAVFIATPHRGSGLADGYLARLVRSLVSLPIASLRTVSEIVTLNEDALNPLIRNLQHLGATSVDTLSPHHPYFAALESRPITVPFHSIIGDRGRAAGPGSSDGVVPYTSSHVSGARSERFVPYGHSCVEPAETVAEVTRILREHLATRRVGRAPSR
jgi:pimeloyl-ACP methyl ester carboxylesterase